MSKNVKIRIAHPVNEIHTRDYDESVLGNIMSTCRTKFPGVFPERVSVGGDSNGDCIIQYKTPIMKQHLLEVIDQMDGVTFR